MPPSGAHRFPGELRPVDALPPIFHDGPKMRNAPSLYRGTSRPTGFLEIERRADGISWTLRQRSGPKILSFASMELPSRREAVEYARQQCRSFGCGMLIRSVKKG
jgi:hypothetical protein